MLAVALLVSSLGALAAARVYERCELARDLLELGVDRERVATWVCIAYHESRFDTAARNFGSGDHGLLQISELFWCGPGKACGAPCSAFRDDDIADDVRCALHIHAEHTRLQGDGFLAWVVYPHHCKQNAKKFIVDCDKNIYKNIPVKAEGKASSFKPSDIRSESKPRFFNNPYRNPVTPRYLSINSIFQGDFVNEFERNYYNNFKQSNWLNFKVDNIDALEIPGGVDEVQRTRYMELTTRPTLVTTFDPDLIGIKPPSPKKIESNQFRRRKTFSQPLFLKKKNKVAEDREKSSTTTAPARAPAERSLSGNEAVSQNIFLKLQPFVLSTSSRELSSPKITSTDISFPAKNPRREENSPVITINDLAQNPFLNSVFRSNFNTKLESTSGLASFDQNNFRGYSLTTSRPEASLRYSKELDFLRFPEVSSNVPESSKSHFLETSENTEITGAIFEQNPFLNRIFRVIDAKPAPGSTENYKSTFILTSAKPTTSISVVKYPSTANYTASEAHLEISTKTPQKLMRSSVRNSTDFDKTTNEIPASENPPTVTYNTRRYHTINRQKTTVTQDDFKNTRAIVRVTEKPTVSSTESTQPTLSSTESTQPTLSSTESTQPTLSSTAPTKLIFFSKAPTKSTFSSIAPTQSTIPLTAPTQEKSFKIETTTTKTTRTLSTTSYKVTKINQRELTAPQSIRRTEITSELPTTRAPTSTSRVSYTRKPAAIDTKTVSVIHSTNRPATVRTLQTVPKPDAASKWQTPRNSTAVRTTSKLLTTNSTQNVRRSDRKMETISRSTRTTTEPQKTNKFDKTRLPTTPRPWSHRRFKEEPRDNSSTTTWRPSANYSWKRPANQLSVTATYFDTTEKSLSTGIEASNAKTTPSIFDLYLRPSTRAPFKPFEFASSGRLRKGINIFSGGTTRPPPSYYSHKNSTAEGFRETDI